MSTESEQMKAYHILSDFHILQISIPKCERDGMCVRPPFRQCKTAKQRRNNGEAATNRQLEKNRESRSVRGVWQKEVEILSSLIIMKNETHTVCGVRQESENRPACV